MNWGIFGWGYGAVLDTYRRRIKYGQGASKVNFEAVVLGTTDNTTGMLRSAGGAAPALSYADLVLQVPYIAGRRGQAHVATGALSVTTPDGSMAGGNRRGQSAVDLQSIRGSSTQVAGGYQSMILGGSSNTANQAYSAAFGWSNNAGSSYAFCIGLGCLADGFGSLTFGLYASTNAVDRSQSLSFSQRATGGDRNIRTIPQMLVTTNATPTILTTDAGAASATKTWALPNNRAASFFGHITARNTATGDMIAWEVKGAFKRGANAAATALVGVPTVTVIANDAALAACTLAITANTTHGALNLTATGLAATTLAWNGVLYGPENG